MRTRGRPRAATADQAIIDAALRQLRDLGYARMSMEAVAAEAGVGKATVYRRYRNKADLATAAIASIHDYPPAPPDVDVRQELVRRLELIEARIGTWGFGAIGSVLGHGADPELQRLLRERIIAPGAAWNHALLTIAQERGEIRADVDLTPAMAMLVGSLFTRALGGHEPQTGTWAQTVVDLLWEGLAAR